MSNIFGTDGFFDSNKVQNQQAIANYTNFTGVLANNGSPIYATGGPFLPLTGGTMSGNIDLGSFDLQNIAACRFVGTVALGDSLTTAGASNSTAVGRNCIIDSGSTAGVILGYNSSVGTSPGVISIGNVCNGGASSNAILIGQSLAATSGTKSIVIGNNSQTSAAQAHAIGASLSNTVANSLLLDASANIRSSSTTCDLGTTALPFRNLQLNGYVLSSSPSTRVPCVRWNATDARGQWGLTTTETDMLASSSTGSLTIPGPTTAGFTAKLSVWWLYQAGAATTLTLRLKVNGTTVATTIIPAGVVVNQTIKCDHDIQLWTPASGTRIYIGIKIDRDLGVPKLNETIADSVWDPAGNNTISLTGQFSDVNGLCAPHFEQLSTSYAS